MKHILLKLEEQDFFKLSNLKSRTSFKENKEFTWEEFVMLLKKRFEQK